MAASTDLLIRLRADGKQAIGELGRVEGAMGKLQRGVGRAATAGAVALVGLAAAGIKEFASFERGMREVFTLLPEISATAMDKMSEQVKTLAVDMGVLPEEVVPALYQAISAGVPEKNVFGFLETATKLSIAGVTDLETAVDGLTTITNAYGVENISAQEAADTLFTAMKLGKTTVGEMSASLFQVVPAAAAAGISIEEVSAGLAAITAQGTPTRVAATQMRQAIVELGKAGTIAFKVFEEATGETFPQFVRGGGTLEEAFQVLAQEAEASGGSISDMFGSVEAGMSALTLTSETGAAAWSSNMDEMADKTGAVAAGFDTMNEGIARGWDKIQAIISVALIEIGESLAPVVEDFLEAFGDKIPGAAAMVGEAFASLIGFGERVGAGFSIVKDAFDSVDGAARTAAGGIGLVGVAMLVIMAHPIVAFLGAVALALSAIGNNAKNAERIGGEFSKNLDEIGDAAAAMMVTLNNQEGIEEFTGILSDAGLSLGGMIEAMQKGGPALSVFQKNLLDAARASTISDIEFNLVMLTMRELGPEMAAVTEELRLLASEEEGAASMARRLAASGVEAATGIALVGPAIDGLDFPDFAKEAEKVTRKVIGAFGELPKQVKKSLGEMEKLLLENIAAKVEWETNLATLRTLGFDAVAQEIEALGPTYAGVLAQMVNDTSGATARMEAILDGADLVAAVRAAVDPDQVAATWATLAAFYEANPLTVRVDPTTGATATLSANAASVLRNIGHEGGIVPGPRGQEVPMLLQAGEKITPLSDMDKGSGVIIINQYIAGSLLAEDEVLEIARQGLRDAAIDGGDLELG